MDIVSNFLLSFNNFFKKLPICSEIFLGKGVDFSLKIRYNREAVKDTERYSNGKEPHWKCGVPQGIVRSSRILSAMVRERRKTFGALFHILLSRQEVLRWQ